MAYRFPVDRARSPYEFVTENQEALRRELAALAVQAIEDQGEVGFEATRLGEVLRTLAGIEQVFRMNGWDT